MRAIARLNGVRPAGRGEEPLTLNSMQAIISKFIPATNTKPSRVKATCERGSITIPHPHELSGDAVHEHAAGLLCARFVAEDAKQYGSDPKTNPWARKRIMGAIPSGDVVHVFVS